jgi:hypothetical protein
LSHHKNKLALFWLTTAVGAVLFVALQSFSYVNDYVKANSKTPTITFDAGALWMFSIFYGAWILTVLLALIETVRSQWAALILGGLLVSVNSFTGVFDGLRDGAHIAFSALFFITLPGVCAIVATLRHLKQKGTRHVDE